MTRQTLERNQVFIYLAAISSGLIVGLSAPGIGTVLEDAVWPVLGLLLYTTFTQVPLHHLRDAFVAPRLLIAASVGNFGVLPLVAWGLMLLAPTDPAVRLGVLLVLLVPCTDWFITFTQLGGGDTKRAIAFAPISLVLQMLLLPVYVWIFYGEGLAVTLVHRNMLMAFVGVILLPLLAAYLTVKWAEGGGNRTSLLHRLGWLPVPLLAIVVFSIAVSQVSLVVGSVSLLSYLLVLFTLFLVLSGGIAKVFAILFRLPAEQGRVLAFSFGTRNSFVLLPLVLALPAAYELAVVVIVFQSLVELCGMAVYLWWVPQRLFPMPS